MPQPKLTLRRERKCELGSRAPEVRAARAADDVRVEAGEVLQVNPSAENRNDERASEHDWRTIIIIVPTASGQPS